MSQIRGDSVDDDGIVGTSTAAGKSGVFGFNAQTGSNGVAGISQGGNGMYAKSDSGNGLYGESGTGAGVRGRSDKGDGVDGHALSAAGRGVFGINESDQEAPQNGTGGVGVFGLTKVPNASGVLGANNHPSRGRGVQGNGAEAGVGGFSIGGWGVIGQSKGNSGVLGTSENGQGVTAISDNDVAVYGKGGSWAGVFDGAVVVNKGPNPKNSSKPPQAVNGSIVINDGNLYVNKGDVILAGADCAEDFDLLVASSAEPGSVMVIGKNGSLAESHKEYDRRVAGVVSGAGSLKPGVILGRAGVSSERPRAPLALVGRVYCRVEAFSAPIEVGDLLTTSSIPGHAMKVVDHQRASGAVLGKAMDSLSTGKGLLLILVSLQ